MGRLFRFLMVALLLVTASLVARGGAGRAAGAGETIFPIKAAVIVDEGTADTGTGSALFKYTSRVLAANRIPYDILDISQGQGLALLDAAGGPKYSVVVLHARGSRISAANSQAIVAAANAGIGAVGLLPDGVNASLAPLFGISSIGGAASTSDNIRVLQDVFTYAYAGVEIQQWGSLLQHSLAAGAQVVARFVPSNRAAVWTYRYGSARTVFHNNQAAATFDYQGVLAQSIIYAMPLGVASPVNAGAVEIDDCTRTYYEANDLQRFHYDYIGNLKRWLDTYNMRASIFVAFSYSLNIKDFWLDPESMAGVNEVLLAGSEIGLHCGSTHEPLDPAYWGGEAGVDAEVDKITAELQLLRSRLASQYGSTLPTTTSNVAPMNAIGSYGYRSLDSRSDIKYVGADFLPWAQWAAGALPSAKDPTLEYIRTRPNAESRARRAKSGMSPLDVTAAAAYTTTYRDFGWEPGTQIYNLPRTQGDFYFFDAPGTTEYYYIWSIYRAVVESGQPYIIFTHPDEVDLVNAEFPVSVTMADIFDAYTVWAEDSARKYPFYRWLKSSEVGDMLTARTGSLDARWLADQQVLQYNQARPDEPIQVKTSLYISGIARSGSMVQVSFSASPVSYQTPEFDIVKSGQNYFIYPPGTNATLPEVPASPFQFQPVSSGNHAPELAPIGNKTVEVGGTLAFNVAAGDFNGDTLSFSCTNLPTGAAFNPATHRFSWTPSTPGVYRDIVFRVSDGALADTEAISITVSGSPPPNSPPVLAPIGNRTGKVGELLAFTVNATDADNDPLIYSASNLPPDASFNGTTRAFSWTPAAAGVFPGVHFEVSDGKATDSEDITITVTSVTPPPNNPPVLAPIGNKSGKVGELLAFTVNATDADNDPLVYSASNLPPGASFNGTTRAFSWTPAAAGVFPGVHFEVTDGKAIDSENITITISGVTPPAEYTIQKTIAVGADDGYSGSWEYNRSARWYEAGNPGKPYTAWFRFTGIDIPRGATILEAYLETVHTAWQSGTRLVIKAEKAANPTAPTTKADVKARVRTTAGAAWTSGYADAAWHRTPDFTAVIQELVNSYEYNGGAIQLLVDNNNSTVGREHVGRTFESGSVPRLFIRYRVGTTPPPNNPPVLAPIGNRTGKVGELLTFTVNATDADNDPLVYSASNLPAGASFNATSHAFSWTPAAAGTFPGVHFEVSDGKAIDSEDITITISGVTPPPNNPPVLAPIGNRTGKVGELLAFTVNATDADNDPLVYSASNLPAGASFNATSHAFSWTPAAAGTFPGVHFEVTDGKAIDSEDITITISGGPPPGSYTIQKSLAAGADDGFSGSWGYFKNLAWYEAGNPGSPYNAWFRFTGIAIPKGAVITEAYLETRHGQWSSGTKLKIRAEKAADPAAPASTADHNARARTTAGADWTSGYGDWALHSSPNFAAVIQELVNSFDYSAGAAVQVLVDNAGSATGAEHVGSTFEDGTPPVLYIKYTVN